MATQDLSYIAADFETQLSGAIAINATSFTLQSITDIDGNDLSDGIYCFTIDRDTTSAKEYLIGQLTAATKTVASISSVSRQGVLTSNAQKAHRIGANVIISDHSILAAISRIFTGQGTINPAAPLEYTTAPTLSSATQIATKGYVDSVVTGGTVNTDRIIIGSQTAGETVAAGNIVYFKSSDGRWWKADADDTATFSNVLLGVALGSGTAGNPVTNGVQIYGKCDSFTGLTATATYYLSNTAGAVSSSAGTFTVPLGQAFATTGIFFNPNAVLATAVNTSAGAGDSGKFVKLNSSGFVDETMIPFDYIKTITRSSGLTTKNIQDASTTQTIAHGLGVAPSKVKIRAVTVVSNYLQVSEGVYDASGQRAQYIGVVGGGNDVATTNGSSTVIIYESSGNLLSDTQLGVVSVDATNITITWTRSGTMSNAATASLMWEAEVYTS